MLGVWFEKSQQNRFACDLVVMSVPSFLACLGGETPLFWQSSGPLFGRVLDGFRS